MQTSPETMSTEEAAQALGFGSAKTFREWARRSGSVGLYRMPGRRALRVDSHDVQRLLEGLREVG